MKADEIREWLKHYEECLKSPDGRELIQHIPKWNKRFPKEAGVYAVFHGDKLVYVGESGSLQGRMRDLQNTLNHTLRRSVGAHNFADVTGYKKALSTKKFPDHIEERVTKFMCRLKIKAMAIGFGRKEIEEHLIGKCKPIYNRKTKRGVRS